MAGSTQNMTVVVGLGVTGLSCVRYLSERGESVLVLDSRAAPPNLQAAKDAFPDIDFICGHFDQALLLDASRIVLSPGVPLATPEIQSALEAGVPVIGDIDLFAEEVAAPVVAITGSNGKSTVTTLVAEMAKADGMNVAAGGNLGTPALDLLDEAVELYVLELSSFQLETSNKLSPKVSTVLNMSEDHMDRYDNFQAYVDAKHRIFQRSECVVVNKSDSRSNPVDAGDAELRYFSIDEKQGSLAYFDDSDERLLVCMGESLVSANDIALKGRHNEGNAAAASLLARSAGVSNKGVITALQEFKGLAHRCEWVSNVAGVDFINDSKGTNTGAAITAIESFGELSEGIIWIAGGVSKDSDMSVLGPVLSEFVRVSVLFGQDANLIAEVARPHTELIQCDSLSEAVKSAKHVAKEGECVLFSPACASFDMFDNYEVRGDAFIDEVHAL